MVFVSKHFGSAHIIAFTLCSVKVLISKSVVVSKSHIPLQEMLEIQLKGFKSIKSLLCHMPLKQCFDWG